MILNFDTLPKILNKETNKMLDDFIEYISTQCESYSLIDIVNKTNAYSETSWHDLVTNLAKNLKEYDVAYDDEDDLTDEGYDFLILYTQKQILEEER